MCKGRRCTYRKDWITVPQKEKSKIIQFLDKLQIPYAFRCPLESWMWDGKTIAMFLTPGNVLHEIAHYLVSTPERRKIPDFGLGVGPDSNPNEEDIDRVRDLINPVRKQIDGNLEESRASLLGIALLKHFGYTDQIVEDFLYDHNWIDRVTDNFGWYWESFCQTIEDLNKLGLMDGFEISNQLLQGKYK